ALVGFDGGRTARVWDVAMGKLFGQPVDHETPIYSLALSPDGKTLWTGGGREIRRWDVATGKMLGQPLQHAGIEFHGFLLSPLGEPLEAPKGQVITQVAFSPDGRLILTGNDPNGRDAEEVRLWERTTHKPLGLVSRPGEGKAAHFSPDGKSLLITGYRPAAW